MFSKENSVSFCLYRCSEGVEGFREQAVTNRIVGMLIEEYDIVFKVLNYF